MPPFVFAVPECFNSQSLASDLEQLNPLISENVEKNHNKTVDVEPTAPCFVTDLFDFQVKSRPNATALHFENGQPITYFDLDHLSSCIATALPLAASTVVPVCLDPSVAMIASIIAILKAGAAYVLLDPKGSMQRNNLIVRDVDATLVITQAPYDLEFETSVLIDSILSKVSQGLITPKTFSSENMTPDEPAYLVYTSGTTGKPKGVVLSHGAATHGITNFNLKGRRRWLLFYNPIFSAAQRTILATLCKGACLCLADRSTMASSTLELVQEMAVDALGITPSALATLSPERVPSCLKQITTVGEPLSDSLVDAWYARVELRVSYGCSECAQLNFSRQLVAGCNPRLVGAPTDTTKAYILEPGNLEKLSMGNSGELCLSGEQLANGYWKLPEITASVFIKNPFGSGRLYRTGDLAIQHGDGSFEIKGRIDLQLKINGQRVEPEEVTTTLSGHSDVLTICVIGATIRDQLSLVAAIVPVPGADWAQLVKTLRETAQKCLPPYMVPSYWLECNTIPCNANLKVDIPKIREIAEEANPHDMLGVSRQRGSETDHVITPEEMIVRNIWGTELNLDPSFIRKDDSFVALGGSSIQAIRVIRALRENGIAMELSSLVQPNTISSLRFSKVDTQNETHAQLSRLELIDDGTLKAELLEDRGIVDAFPLTPLQESLLASSLQGNTAYLYQRVYEIRHLDLKRLRLAFQAVFLSSENLRSTFLLQGPAMYQSVRNDFQFPWFESDESIEDFQIADKQAGFSLGQPFSRFNVLSKQILIVSMHHALFDFWSHSFLFEDVASLYHGLQPRSRPSWGKYIKYLKGQDKGMMEDYWHEYLLEAQPTILNHARSLATSETTLQLAVKFKSAQAALGATSGAIIYAAWALVLARHTNSNDVVFATAVAGREAPIADIERLDGPTLTVVPQRVIVEPDSTLNDLIRSTSSKLWKSVKHSQYGMRGALKASGHANEKLFDTFVNILVKGQPRSTTAEKLFQAYGKRPVWETGFTTLEIEESADSVFLRLIADMEPRRMQYILDELARTIELMVGQPQATVGSLDVLGAAERQWLIQKAQPVQSGARLLHSHFEDIARTDPGRMALSWQRLRTYSYGELDELSSRMASFLSHSGLKKGDLVPLLFEKSPTMIIAILATLKVGAAYIPLSPDNPLERNLAIIKQVVAKSVLTEDALKSYFPTNEVQLLIVDTIELDAFSPEPIHSGISPNDLAYIIFTSGSTGVPKGVMISHEAVATAMDALNEFLGHRDDPRTYRTLQFSNYIFDVSVYDIFTTLSSGSTLCMAPTDRLLSELAEVISEMEVTHCFLTPTVVRLLKPSEVPSLKTLSIGGEPMSQEIVDTWSNKLRLINGYGPTEASVIVTTREVSAGSMARNIGSPLRSSPAIILDPISDSVLPYGAIGEVAFIGPQLGRGYYQSPQQTSKVFYKSNIEGLGRLYRSGDLARWLPHGELECLGRKDYQIKLNGFRIELGEIEHALLRTEALIDGVVVVADLHEKPQLVAFVVFEDCDDKGILELESFSTHVDRMKGGLKSLTPYMIPKFILPLGKMPKMPSGKPDRKMLKKLAESLSIQKLGSYAYNMIGTSITHMTIPLRSEEQRLLKECWKEVLNLGNDDFGLEGHFFNLGGDSIAAINLTSTLRQKGYSLKVGQIMESPDLGAMSQHIVRNREDVSRPITFNATSEVAKLFAGCEYEYIYPCPPGQSQFLASGRQPEKFWTLMTARKLAEGTKVEEWLQLVSSLTQANEILRTTFAEHEGHWYGAVLNDTSPVVEFADVSAEEDKSRILYRVWESTFVCGRPYIRYVILCFPDGHLEVVTKLDHGLYDGTLLRVFAGHFEAIADGRPIPDHTAFIDYALHEWRSDKSRALEYWLNPDRRPHSFKYPRVQKPCISGSVVTLCPTSLESLSKAHAISPSILYQAAFQLWLAYRSGSVDVSLDYLYTGRNVPLPDPQSINGTCANFLPLRTQINLTQTCGEYVTETQASFWAATENSNVGLQDIYRAANTSTEECGNTALFLFQPFEPAAAKLSSGQDRQWIAMALSKVTMLQPYAIVCEVIRTGTEMHKLKIGYDSTAFSEEEARQVASEIGSLVDALANGLEMRVQDILPKQ